MWGGKLHGIIDVALIQSCVSDNAVKPFVKNYRMVIADECHHVSAINYEQILKTPNARAKKQSLSFERLHDTSLYSILTR